MDQKRIETVAQTRLRPALAALFLAFGLIFSGPALAQFSDGYKFLEAVRKSDNDKVIAAVEQPGVTPINTRDSGTGETALMITIGRRDLPWSNYLLSHGARTDIADNSGKTPLMLAVERRFLEGAQLLLAHHANPNTPNNSGETPLIRAVQFGDSDMVRLLLEAGADPTRRDNIAGMSAIDYAKRDQRVPGLVELLSRYQKKPKAKNVQGPEL